ncbi:MAG: hypothetical protein RMJ87_10940 [Cytophagales bacterium]|nr:hypothetical protein [Bernardetiaceae bacterium]MDW8205536.1 hypothetical protein [Cytophagales bacterium]
MHILCVSFKRPYLWIAIVALGSIAILIYIFLKHWQVYPLKSNQTEWEIDYAIRKVNANYGKQVDTYARQLGLPADYFKALILLECSANVPPGSRYEPHVFLKLKAVQNRILESYNGIKYVHLIGCSDQVLRKMATSWGPLQIMGYHAIHLGIHIDELVGNRSLYLGMVWAKQTYGYLLKRKAYRDAFHFHNTGKLYPKYGKPTTYNPYYVGNGIMYMRKMKSMQN